MARRNDASGEMTTTMNPTTTHSSEVVGQLALIETDPIRQRVEHAIAGFLAGHSGTTLAAYRLDLRGWITWLDAAFLDPFAVERAHIELYAHWCESEGKPAPRSDDGCRGRDHALACLSAC